jgi:cell division protein FtsQ
MDSCRCDYAFFDNKKIELNGGAKMDKVIDIEERIPSMREKRRRKTNRKFLFILTVFVAALLVILYFQSPLSRIGIVSVSETTLNDKDFYLEKSGLAVDKPFWGFDATAIEKSLANLAGVRSVTVSRKWLRDVDIGIKEWETVAYIQDDGNYNLLLENGDSFPTEILLPEAEAPVLNGFDDAKDRKRMTIQLMKLNRDVYHLISEIKYMDNGEHTDRLTVYMDDGFEVRAVIQTFAEKMGYYSDITAQLNGLEKGVIDMEVGTFFTPFSEMYGPSKEDDSIDEEEE